MSATRSFNPAFTTAAMSAVLLVACTGNKAAVERIDRMTPAQFAHAFCTIAAMPESGLFQGARMPAEFRALGAQSIRRYGTLTDIHVSGGVDDVVSLIVDTKRGVIRLIPGEVDPPRVVWTAPSRFACAPQATSSDEP